MSAHGGQLPAAVHRLFPDSLLRELTALRRDLHRHPELSGDEARTGDKLLAAVTALQPATVERCAGHGIVARFSGRDPDAPVIAVRGDMDALPINEETGLEWASTVPGVMHACGHDVHATWAVGAAALLQRAPAAGDVILILQPAEEVGEGAKGVLAAGALSGVSAIFGGHVDRRYVLGEVVAQEGPLAAASDVFRIELTGSAAHGARPHEGCDPIVGAGALISGLHTIVGRRLNPADAAVLTIGRVQAGSAPNIIPGRASLSGTLRSQTTAVRAGLQRAVQEMSQHVAAAYGLTATVDFTHRSPPLLNDARMTLAARGAVAELLGPAALVPLEFANLAGEDFAWYLEQLPGCFLRIGAREAGGSHIPAHSPRFFVPDEAIFVGAAVLAGCVRSAAASLSDAAR